MDFVAGPEHDVGRIDRAQGVSHRHDDPAFGRRHKLEWGSGRVAEEQFFGIGNPRQVYALGENKRLDFRKPAFQESFSWFLRKLFPRLPTCGR